MVTNIREALKDRLEFLWRQNGLLTSTPTQEQLYQTAQHIISIIHLEQLANIGNVLGSHRLQIGQILSNGRNTGHQTRMDLPFVRRRILWKV